MAEMLEEGFGREGIGDVRFGDGGGGEDGGSAGAGAAGGGGSRTAAAAALGNGREDPKVLHG